MEHYGGFCSWTADLNATISLILCKYLRIMTADINKTDDGRIEVLHGNEIIINTYLHILHNANSRWDYFADARSLSVRDL